MADQDTGPVVVAVGHDPMDAALAFAADEAARAGGGLRLVHAVHLLVQGPDMPLAGEVDLEREGRRALNAAVARARELAGDVPVTTELRVGPVVPTIIDMAGDARMIVLQRRDLSTVRRVVTRSISSTVAARARVPVVSVPSRWSARAPGDPASVTVGVDLPERAEQVLRWAAGEARSRGAVLRILHTWSFPSAYDDIVLDPAESQAWADRTTDEIQAVLDTLDDDLAGMPVVVEARHAYAADALVEAGRETDLLVIGRHDPLVPVGSHLGPIARAVLREADCPVMIVDLRRRQGAGRPALRTEEEVQPA